MSESDTSVELCYHDMGTLFKRICIWFRNLEISDETGTLAEALTSKYLSKAEPGNFTSMLPGLVDVSWDHLSQYQIISRMRLKKITIVYSFAVWRLLNLADMKQYSSIHETIPIRTGIHSNLKGETLFITLDIILVKRSHFLQVKMWF